jgi:hypothetical protein
MKILKQFLAGFLFVAAIYSCTKSDINRNADNTNNNTDSTFHLNFSGQLKTCNNRDLTNGNLVIATNQGYELMHIMNGNFDTTLTSTGRFDSVAIWVIDMDSLTVSDTIRMQVSSDSINLGTLNVCVRNANEYIKCNIGNDTFVYVPMLFDTLSAGGFDTLGAPTTYFYRSSQHIGNSTFYRMQFAGMTMGTFGVNWNSTIHMGRYYSFNMPSAGTVTYTSYEPVGGHIEGTLHVPFVDNTDSLHYTLTGSFRVRRDY